MISSKAARRPAAMCSSVLRSVAQDELNAADQEKMIGIAILSFISLVTLVFYFFVKNALSVMRVRPRIKCNVSTRLIYNPLYSGVCKRGAGKSKRA